MSLYLAVETSHDPRQLFRLESATTLRIGRRRDADIVLRDSHVSRLHCMADVRDDHVWIHDTGSLNGTWVGGWRLHNQAYRLEPGGLVRLGSARMTLLDSLTDQEDLNSRESRGPRWLMSYLPARGSRRKLLLLACAFSRLLLPRMPGIHGQEFVETAERFADGLVTVEQLEEARRKAAAEQLCLGSGDDAWLATAHLAEFCDREAAQRSLDVVKRFLPDSPVPDVLVRDVLGDFFLPESVKELAALREDRTVAAVAQVIYAARSFADMPVLADALEDAGCTQVEVLSHCRSGSEHVRGCWVLDALLGSRPWSRATPSAVLPVSVQLC
jgi:hypothetical protein